MKTKIPHRLYGHMSTRAFIAAIFFIFFSFVFLGISGSSINFGIDRTGIISQRATTIFGAARGIRSDEWLVTTSLSIAQAHHDPKFPVVNRNLRDDGINMLITSGLGQIPIAHISSLAKPSTWGFFLFDLRQALAWQWWFPFFGGLLALWWLLNILAPNQSLINLGLTFFFCLSPYVTAWSNTPLYYCFFPTISFCLIYSLFNNWRGKWSPIVSLPLGLGFAGFVMTLYPAWQVPIGYIFLILSLFFFFTQQWWRLKQWPAWLTIAIALCIAGLLLSAWYLDAKPAIHAMQETIYPGRRLSTGGDTSLSLLLQGYSNIYTIYSEHLTDTNQSEVSGFLIFIFPLLALSAIYIKRKGNDSILVILFLLYLAAILYYQFVGFPISLSKISFFSYVTSKRLIIAVGFIELILLAILIRARAEVDGKLDFGTVKSSVVAVIWTLIIIFSIRYASYYDSTFKLFLLPIGFATFLASYWLLRGKSAQFLVLALLWSLSMSLPFNPIVRLPSQFSLRPEIEALVSSKRPGGILVLNAGSAVPMYYAAAGFKVINGVFYYPPRSLWSRLDPNNELTHVHNRYQHLVFDVDANLDQDIKYTVPQPDLIVAKINPASFDFNKTGASMVTIRSVLDTSMNSNPSLRPHGSANGWSFFDVTPIAGDQISDFRQK